MINVVKKVREYLPVFFLALMLFPAFQKYQEIFFIDLRQQEVSMFEKGSLFSLVTAAGCALLTAGLAFEWLRRSGRSGREFFLAVLPLAGLGIIWFLPVTFSTLLVCIFLAAWGTGRCAALGSFSKIPELKGKQALIIIILLCLLYAAAGFWQQLRALNTLSMAWFDWGHFFESLNNFFSGRPFYLNLCGGSFLASRFSPTLVLLLPVVMTGSTELFLLTGNLLVASGAVFVYLISRALKGSVRESLCLGLWYFFIPGVANMNLPLIDGFHEVFMLFPLVLCLVWFALKKWYIPAGIVFLLTLGVRETAGVIFAGYGIVLFAMGHRKKGIALFAVSALYVFAALKIFMPLFDTAAQETYVHTRYFSHLGSNMYEIALSPLTKPEVFFPSLFSGRNFFFWIMLAIPFTPLAFLAWPWILPLIPELVMLSVDRRFDTQSVLRHYQISLLLVLITATAAGAARMREKGVPGWIKKFFAALHAPDCRQGVFGAAAAGTLAASALFVHFPGLPCSEPQRRYSAPEHIPLWQDARPAMERIKKLIPKGSGVTAGPRLASMLLPEYDVYFDFAPDEKKLQDHVLIENFFTFYFPENELSRYLTLSPGWELIHQEFIDERSVQLFRRTKKKLAKKKPLAALDHRRWQNCGALIPCRVDDLEVRGAVIAPGTLRFGARLKKKRLHDAGFRVEMQFASGKKMKYFTSFAHGRFPADLADPGDTFFFAVTYPPSETLAQCRVSVVELVGAAAPQ